MSNIARMADVSESVIRKWRDGVSSPSLENLTALAHAAGVSVGWLAGGNDIEAPREIRETAAGYYAPQPTGTLIPIPSQPLCGVAAGDLPPPYLALAQTWLETAGLDPAPLVATTAMGDAMEPTISHGSLLLVDTAQHQIGDSALYLLKWKQNLHPKRLQRLHDGTVRIVCDNPHYADEILSPEQAEQLDIIGKIVWVGRRI